MKQLLCIAIAIITFCSPRNTLAVTLVNLDFDSYTAGQSLNGQSGSSDAGLSGTFSSGFASSVTVVAASGANNLSYQVSGGGTISSGSNVLRFAAPDSNVDTIFSRSLSTPISGQTVYVRVIVNPIAPSTNSNTFMNFFINSNSLPNGTYDLLMGTGLGAFGTSTGAGIGNNYYSNQLATSGSLVTGQPNLLVARYNYTAGVGYTSVDFFLNPTATTTTPNSSATFPAGVSSLNMIGLAVANLAASGTPTYDFDSFAVGTQWSDVVPSSNTLLVNLNFDSGYTANQTLNGQSSTSDIGLSGTFSSSFPGAVNIVPANGTESLGYQVTGGSTISGGSNVLRFTAPDSNVDTIFSRSLSTPISGQTVYVRVIVNPIVPSTNSGTYMNFFINSNSLPNGTYDLLMGTGLGAFGTTTGAGIGNNYYSNHVATFGSLVTGQLNLLVARYNYTAGVGYTSVDFFLNPTATTTTPNSSATFSAGVPSLNMIGLAVANLSGTSPTYDFDSFAVATQWSGVVPAANGTTYYVSPSGSDSNNGTTTSTPWQTIAKVNAHAFNAGDSILFLGGGTFSGSLSGAGGTATSPITYSSYGTGRATISAGTGTGFSASNKTGIVVSNLNFVGVSWSSNTGSGIELSGVTTVTINSCDVGGFNEDGIGIGLGSSAVNITQCSVHDCGYTGVDVWGTWDSAGTGTTYSNSNIYIGYCTVWNIYGRTNGEDHTGNGIFIWDVSNSTVERCVVHDCGVNNTSSSGPVGIWCFQASSILFQYNESYHNLTSSSDGDGFDFDGGTINSTLQYNYAHDNAGSGILSWEYSGARPMNGNTFRYNICQNNATRSTFYSEITIGGGSEPNTLIYNNTLYSIITAALDGSTLGSGSCIRNNLLITTNGHALLTGYGSAVVQGNDYWSSGAAESIVGYSNLAAFRTATAQEMLSGQPTGHELNPLLNNAGGGGTIGNPNLLNTLTAYQLQSSSPLINAGLNLQSLFGINPGSQDFFGVTTPQSGAYDVGASEY